MGAGRVTSELEVKVATLDAKVDRMAELLIGVSTKLETLLGKQPQPRAPGDALQNSHRRELRSMKVEDGDNSIAMKARAPSLRGRMCTFGSHEDGMCGGFASEYHVANGALDGEHCTGEAGERDKTITTKNPLGC